jgi:hypothetical protein
MYVIDHLPCGWDLVGQSAGSPARTLDREARVWTCGTSRRHGRGPPAKDDTESLWVPTSTGYRPPAGTVEVPGGGQWRYERSR